jgi:hypothetical protein
MLILYSYPELFGVTDHNGYGLKMFGFLVLAGVPFRHSTFPMHRMRPAVAPSTML